MTPEEQAAADAAAALAAAEAAKNKPPVVTAEEAQALKDQLAAARKEKNDLAAKVTELSSSVEQLKTKTLKSNGEYKTLHEQAELKIQELEVEKNRLKDSIFHTSRVSSVKDAAVKLGLRSAALSDIEAMDLDEIQVKVGEDKIIRVEGATDFATKLKTMKPYLFETPKDPKFNGGGGSGGAGGGGGAGDVTQQDLAAAFQLRNKGPAELKAYRELTKKFDEQTRKAKAK